MRVAVLGDFLPGESRSMSKSPAIETPEPQRLMVICHPQQQIAVILAQRTYRHIENFLIGHGWVTATAPVSFICFSETVAPRRICDDNPILFMRDRWQIWYQVKCDR